MNNKQIDYVIETAKTMNLSRAAENLFISQPSLSYQIKVLEEEVGFLIFDRIGKSIRLTPAGQQLVTSLQGIQLDLKTAIEQAQNLGSQYQDSITIAIPNWTALYLLPQAIKAFEKIHPQVQIVPQILPNQQGIASFLRQETDLILLPDYEADKLQHIQCDPLFTSQIYLLCLPEDPLAQKERVTAQDLAHRTLLVNGGSSKRLQQVQQRVISQVPIQQLNSPNHDFTLIQVASQKAICLSPGIYQDRNSAFSWLPFDCQENFPFSLCRHEQDERPAIKDFIKTLQEVYEETDLSL
ncbi:LysR family transcriptional regulator [Streptococcus macacae]|uniref:LysR substrate binding domain protein n=1 Tax=Streptococcus macacae NCTC 11558 TaxID=764298 RepID=G5JUP2_9STRE|nr:LysR family transcriptional regulator [Streptococcus macacae]EHJ51734.1 LysR substrate binding domain protein [Streptococcus macacae NCTC 11558]SUN78858.1 LysR family transcriptional regulator [Streptococcus macacae NCTC 11558]